MGLKSGPPGRLTHPPSSGRGILTGRCSPPPLPFSLARRLAASGFVVRGIEGRPTKASLKDPLSRTIDRIVKEAGSMQSAGATLPVGGDHSGLTSYVGESRRVRRGILHSSTARCLPPRSSVGRDFVATGVASSSAATRVILPGFFSRSTPRLGFLPKLAGVVVPDRVISCGDRATYDDHHR